MSQPTEPYLMSDVPDSTASMYASPAGTESSRPEEARVWPDLNEAQQSAVRASLEPQLVIAGPGTGKTRVLVCRAAHLLTHHADRIRPSQLAVITFTRKAARQLTSRLADLIGSRAQHVRAGTIHQFCAYILKSHGDAVGLDPDIVVAPEAVTDAFWQRWFEANRGWAKSNDLTTYRSVKLRVSQVKLGFKPVRGRLQAGIREYDEMLGERGALDFDDLLVHARDAVNIDRVRDAVRETTRAILVDEFQDTDPVQFRVIERVARAPEERAGAHLFCVADDDQSIYQFRGARPQNLRDLIDTFGCTRTSGRQHVLSTNYRSNRAIYAVAESVLPAEERIKQEGEVTTASEDASPVDLIAYDTPDREEEAALRRVSQWIEDGVPHREIAVLAPWNDHVRGLEERFLRAGIACEASSTDPILDTPAMQRLRSVFAVVERVVSAGTLPDGPLQDVLDVILPDAASASVENVRQRSGATVWGTYQRFARDRSAAEEEGLGAQWQIFEQTYAALVNIIQQARSPEAKIGELAEEILQQLGGSTDLLEDAAAGLPDPLEATGVLSAAERLRQWKKTRMEAGEDHGGRILVFDRNFSHVRILRALLRHALDLEEAPDHVPNRSPAAFVAVGDEAPRPLGEGDLVVTRQAEAFLDWADRNDALAQTRPHILDVGGWAAGYERLVLADWDLDDITRVAPDEYHAAAVRLFALLQAVTAPMEPEPAFPEYVMVDLETTGLDVKRCHVAEIGAVRIRNGEEVDAMEVQIELPSDLPEEAIETLETVCGMDVDADFSDAVPAGEAWRRFAAFCRSLPITAHNGRQFDFRILRRMHGDHGDGEQEPWTTTYDTLPLATRLCPELQHHTAESLRAALLGDDAPTVHRALADCRDQQAILEALQARQAVMQRKTACEPLLPLVLAGVRTEMSLREAHEAAPDWSDGERRLLETGYRWALRDASAAARVLRDILPRSLAEMVRATPDLYDVFDEARLLADDASSQPGLTGRIEAVLAPFRDQSVRDHLADFLSHLALWGHEEAERGDAVVTLSTYHSAKGLEFERVICTRVNSDHFPPFYARTQEERDEQRRVLYVGLTRAEKRLVVTHYTEGKYGDLSRSPFLRNVPRDAVVIHDGT